MSDYVSYNSASNVKALVLRTFVWTFVWSSTVYGDCKQMPSSSAELNVRGVQSVHCPLSSHRWSPVHGK